MSVLANRRCTRSVCRTIGSLVAIKKHNHNASLDHERETESRGYLCVLSNHQHSVVSHADW